MKCKFCEREYEHRGALNLHQRACELKYYRNQSKGEEEMADKQEKGCQHEYRLLNRKVAVENFAINDGYKEVCTKCQNLKQ